MNRHSVKFEVREFIRNLTFVKSKNQQLVTKS